MRTKHRVGVIALAIFAVVASWLPAAAIISGEPDGNRHPFVGLVAFYGADGAYSHRCSGTLIAPRLFLTAGHCTSQTASAKVWFDSELPSHPRTNPPGGITGTPHTHPRFDDFATYPESWDIGVVVLDESPRVDVSGRLPEAGELDDLARKRGRQDVTFTAVGYGLQRVKPEARADLTRYQATLELVNLGNALTDGFNLQHTGGDGTGGATCFGDSGGPIFKGNSNVVVAVTSWGPNKTCRGAGFGYRVDLRGSLDFVQRYL